MWDAADRAMLIDPDLPGYALATKADLSTVGGLFRQAYAEAFNNVGGLRPSFFCPADQAPSSSTTMVIDGVTYLVARSMPDGNGFSTLDLDLA